MQVCGRKQIRRRSAGFTLVELMVVIAIIAILATVVGVNALRWADEGDVTAATAQIKNFETALIGYKLKFKQFPDSLDQLVDNEKDINFMDSDKIPDDPWGNPYVYTKKGSSDYTIISYGADGSKGGKGYDADISSDDLKGEK